MIRRGLQFLFSVVLVGAAPSYAQTIDYSHYPAFLTASGFSNTAWNGMYVLGQFTQGVVEYYTYPRDDGTGTYVMRVTYNEADGRITVAIWQGGSTLTQKFLYGWYDNPLPETITGFSVGGGIVVPTVSPPDPYEQAFPDWESAAVKIPLGFAFGLALWASVLAFHVPMQWVRSLSERAT